MTTNEAIKSYEIDNICNDNESFLLECPSELKFSGKFITTDEILSSRQILWDYLLSSDVLKGKFCYILSHVQTLTSKKSQVWILKNKIWTYKPLIDLKFLSESKTKSFAALEVGNLTQVFFWVRVELTHSDSMQIDKLLDTDKFFLIISEKDIKNDLDSFITNGWSYSSLRQMQVPPRILNFIYGKNLQCLISLGRFDDKEKELVIITPKPKISIL